MFSVFPLFFLLVVVVAVVAGVIAYRAAKKRREAMSAYAAARGWSWVDRDDNVIGLFDGSPFGVGHGRHARNVIRGSHDGRPMVAFDYEFTTSSGSGRNRSSTTHHYSVIAVSAGVDLPDLAVTPQNLLNGFFGRLSNRDIELESERFNEAFVVTAGDRKFASDVVHPRMMELLLTRPDLAWRFEGGSIVTIERGQHQPATVDAALAHLDAILDSVPEFVWREARGQ